MVDPGRVKISWYVLQSRIGRAECKSGIEDRKRGYVIETGEIVLADDADKLLSDPQVKEAYLGG